ncbi:MAG: uroporphyrinogen decarboxylase family protein, partial [Eubacteriales bacterium]
GVVIAEPLAGILNPQLIKEFSTPYVRKIADAVQDDNFIVVYHNCGNNTIILLDSILETGASAFHFGNAINMQEMVEKFPADKIVLGNIDPSGLFRYGTPESVREATLDLLQKCGSHSNFVISSGCDIPPMSKWENIDAFFAAVDEHYSR